MSITEEKTRVLHHAINNTLSSTMLEITDFRHVVAFLNEEKGLDPSAATEWLINKETALLLKSKGISSKEYATAVLKNGGNVKAGIDEVLAKQYKLYIISQKKPGYDEYVGAVVCATSEDEARNIHPSGHAWRADDASWASCPQEVDVVELMARGPSRVVLASFHGGKTKNGDPCKTKLCPFQGGDLCRFHVLSEDLRQEPLEYLVTTYTLKEIVGSDDLTTVYKALRKFDSKLVALKAQMLPAATSYALQHIVREVEVWKKIAGCKAKESSCALVPIHNVFYVIKDNMVVLWIDMEFMGDGDLLAASARIRENLDPEKLRQALIFTAKQFLPVLATVDRMHKLQVVHRDLQLASILIDSARKRMVVGGFGAGCIAQECATRRLSGNMLHLDPYVVTVGSATLDKASDVYSLGVSLYMMFTGKEFMGVSEVGRLAKFLRHNSSEALIKTKAMFTMLYTKRRKDLLDLAKFFSDDTVTHNLILQTAEMIIPFNPEQRPTCEIIIQRVGRDEITLD